MSNFGNYFFNLIANNFKKGYDKPSFIKFTIGENRYGFNMGSFNFDSNSYDCITGSLHEKIRQRQCRGREENKNLRYVAFFRGSHMDDNSKISIMIE